MLSGTSAEAISIFDSRGHVRKEDVYAEVTDLAKERKGQQVINALGTVVSRGMHVCLMSRG